MAEYGTGYLPALQGVGITVRQMVGGTDVSEGKVELLDVVSFMSGLINAKVARHVD